MHVTREFSLNFLVSFLFFFFIFFINQILLLVQQIALKNVDVRTILILVLCAIPQFLQYVVPFATLSASSMVLGDLGSANELMALRSSGIPLARVYRVLVICSLFLSAVTFFISDCLMPASSRVYQDMLTKVMRELPTFEIEPNSVNTVGNIVLSNGQSEGNEIRDIVLLSQEEDGQSRTVLSDRGVLELIDSDNYIYSLELDSPRILLTEDDDIESYGLSSADKATFFLDF